MALFFLVLCPPGDSVSDMKRIVLASGSPRRKDLLSMMGWSFDVVVSSVEEKVIQGELPEVTVCRLAEEKAVDVQSRLNGHEDSFIIGADTVVVLDGCVLGKPSSPEESFDMVRKLNGREHVVYTGLSVLKGRERATSFEKTVVCFKKVEEEDLLTYVKTGEGMDKAGAYALQGVGAIMVKAIKGDYYNVVGLPLCRLASVMQEMGCSLSDMWRN